MAVGAGLLAARLWAGPPVPVQTPPSGLLDIMPLGDSITKGIVGAYRPELFSLSDHTITFLGSQSNGPDTVDGETFPKAHEAYDSATIATIDGVIPAALSVNPQLILLHLGTNDLLFSGADGVAADLAALIDQIIADKPDTWIAVAQIIPITAEPWLTDHPGHWEQYNSEVATAVNTRIGQGKKLILADLSGFPTNLLDGDGVHPTDPAGYEHLAGLWFGVIGAYL